MSQATLAVAVNDGKASIQVRGRATFECSEDLKRFCNKVLSQKIPTITFHMPECTGMDSTFMGMMAKISLMARQQSTVVEISNINDDNKKNICSLGLKDMFSFVETEAKEADSWQNLPQSEVSQKEQKQNIIDAHQTLIDAHEDNKAEFQDIVDFLKMEDDSEEN